MSTQRRDILKFSLAAATAAALPAGPSLAQAQTPTTEADWVRLALDRDATLARMLPRDWLASSQKD